jgi:hypothetical protein
MENFKDFDQYIRTFNATPFLNGQPESSENQKRKKLIEIICGDFFEYDVHYNVISQKNPDTLWKTTFKLVSSIKNVTFYLKFRVTPELFSHIRYDYDEIRHSKNTGIYSTQAHYDERRNLVVLHNCVQQNNGDEDGYDVGGDDYADGAIDENGVFVEPLTV